MLKPTLLPQSTPQTIPKAIPNTTAQTTHQTTHQAVNSLHALSNEEIALRFEQVADLLEAQGDDYYRIRAYRKGANAVRAQTLPVVELFAAEGTKGLKQIRYIGRSLSQSIQELAETGNLKLLQQLSIDVSPEDLFTTVPGVGQVLARRLYRGLGLRSLTELEQAAKTGRLAQVTGFGKSRIAWVQASVSAMLHEKPFHRA